MTRITKIILHGFKSFPKRTEIPLGEKFNVILGPNGSGKSNVLDAVCFVLGKLSAKGLRAEKQANLIYDGGKTGQPAKYAFVELHFDNSNQTFPYEDKEIVISRKVLSTGNSIYKINNRNASRKEILGLLATANIDPEGYNIVLQGDINKIIDMTNENKRQLIEEVADITLYEEKKHQALLELQKVEEKLKEAKIVLTERKTYLDELREEYKQALKYKELMDRAESTKATYLYLEIQDKSLKLKEAEDKLNNLKKKEKELLQEIKKTEKCATDTNEKITKINKEIEQKGERDQVLLHKQVEGIRVKISSNSARIDSCKQELVKLRKRKEALNSQLKEIQDKLRQIQHDKKLVANDMEKLNREKKLILEQLADLKKKHKIEDTSSLEQDIELLDKGYETLNEKLFRLKEEYQQRLREKDRYQMELDNLQQRMEKLAAIEAENKRELNRLKQLKQNYKQATLELAKLTNEAATIAHKLATVRDRLLKVREELTKLQLRRNAITETITGNIAIKRLLELRRTMKGIHGTVSGLGSVKSKYALALEVAAGAHIRDIVVDNEDVAIQCINFLRKNKLGVATFLPMNKIASYKPREEVKKLLAANGVHGLAIELISFPPEYRRVFEYVFRDTIVVRDLEVAKRLGIGKARIVTLQGDLVETSGAMIGGFRRERKRALSFQEEEVSKHLEELEQEKKHLEALAGALEQKQQLTEESISKLKMEKAELEASIVKSEKSLHLESEDLTASEQQRTLLEANLNKTENQLNALSKQISGLTKELTENRMKREKLKQQLAVIRDPKVIGQMAAYEEKSNKIEQEVLQLKSKLGQLELQEKEVYGKEALSINQVMKQLDKESQSFENEIKQKTEENTKLSKQLKQQEKKAEVFYSKYKELFKQRNKLSDTLRELEVKKAQLSDKLRGNELKQNSLQLEKATLKAQLAGLEQEFEQFKNTPRLEEKSVSQLKREIAKLEAMMSERQNINLKALDIYERVKEEYENLVKKRDKLLKEKEDVEKLMHEIDAKKKDLFLETFNVLNENFKRFFSKLSSKGEAYLKLENEENPFEGGVEIKVKLSSNRFLDIRSLSGGEKSMTALAFIFAIQEYKPATFYVLDEVDAALDKHNSEKLAKLIKHYSEKAQYIVISHNDYIIQEADTLFGVSMTENHISKVVSLRV